VFVLERCPPSRNEAYKSIEKTHGGSHVYKIGKGCLPVLFTFFECLWTEHRAANRKLRVAGQKEVM